MGDDGGSVGRSGHAVGWFAVIVFAYYYKAFLFGFLGNVLGVNWFGTVMIRGISTNHWIEILLYCPMLWLALHQVNQRVFAGGDDRRRLVGDLAIAVVIYGSGVHIANVIELYSREQAGVSDGDVYDLVYFIDEGMSHYLQFVPLFFVIGWFVIHDPLGPTRYPTLAVFLGVGHGVERAVGIIEGGKWFLGPATIVWLGLAAAIRQRHIRRFGLVGQDDFWLRYAVAFCVTLPVAQLAYLARYGSFAQPSGLGDGRMRVMAAGAIVLTVGGTCAMLLSERWWNPRSGVEPIEQRSRRHRPVGHDAVQQRQLALVDARRLAPGVHTQPARPRLVDERPAHDRPVSRDAVRPEAPGVVEESLHVVGTPGVAEQGALDVG